MMSLKINIYILPHSADMPLWELNKFADFYFTSKPNVIGHSKGEHGFKHMHLAWMRASYKFYQKKIDFTKCLEIVAQNYENLKKYIKFVGL